MGVFRSTSFLPRFRNAVLTIGTFDGVHLGHQAILAQLVQRAKDVDGESVLITFEPHPRKLLHPEQPLQILTPLDQKLEYLKLLGIDHVVVQDFTKDFAALSAAEYVKDFLVGKFHPHSIIIGYDHRFGADRAGNITLLESVGEASHFAVERIPAQMIDDAAISSTKIRRALENGDMQTAAAMLGREYTLQGTVVIGAQIGRTIGYPTANIVPQDVDQLVPGRGVYAVRAVAGGQTYSAMLNIGFRPTVSSEMKLHIEAHLFGFNGDIYGQMLKISFVDKLRDEMKFTGLDALKEQLAKDAIAAKKVLSD